MDRFEKKERWSERVSARMHATKKIVEMCYKHGHECIRRA